MDRGNQAMSGPMSDFVESFVSDASELLDTCEEALLEMEEANLQGPDLQINLDAIFRGLHTLKGTAAFLGLNLISQMAHSLEDLFQPAREKCALPESSVMNCLFEGVSLFREIFVGLAQRRQEEEWQQQIQPFIKKQCGVSRDISDLGGKESKKTISSLKVKEQEAEKVKGMDKRGYISSPTSSESRKMSRQNEPFLKVRASKVDLLMDLVGNIGIAIGEVFNHPDLQRLEIEGFNEAAHRVNVLMRQLQDETAGLRLVAVAGAFRPMQRLVRDLARSTGKQLKLVLEGADTELDKIVVENLNDPLVHMVRNAADHGIESPEERAAAGKPAMGTILLKASQRGGEVLIEIRDDGKGLDRDAILRKAREKGILEPEEIPEDSRIWNLIFHPGFSTAEKVTNISGRGVGMDVVQNTIKELRGRMSVESYPGEGSSVVMHIPLTLAFLDSMIVSESNINYAIPIEAVCEVLKPVPEQITSSSSDNSRYVRVRDDLVPIFSLREFYCLGNNEKKNDTHNKNEVNSNLGTKQKNGVPLLLIVQTGDRPLAIPVDDVAGQQQVTIKPLQGQARSIRAGAGWALLGSGTTALVLDCARIAEGGNI